MRIFGMGLPEIIVIVVIICIIAGPALVKKLGKRGADTAKALKDTVEENAKEIDFGSDDSEEEEKKEA